jgi:hypothetical protein
MFSKISRYRRVPDVAVPDAEGRVLASKGLRLLPQVSGTFRHTVEAGDRLDQLSYKYYGQPLQWWHICDASPQFLSPLALLGQEPVVTTRFPVSVTAGDPPWSALFRQLTDVVGVEDVQVLEDVELTPQQQTVAGQTVTVFVEHYTRTVLVTYNRLNVSPAILADGIANAGFQVGPPTDTGQLGQEIVIPPAVTG